jgi:hypothetical protein
MNFAMFVGLSTGKKFVPESELFNIWVSALEDLSPVQIWNAGEKLMRVWRYSNLPMPGDVRAQVETATEKANELEADNEWQKALRVATDFYQPDIGLYRNAPKLEPATWHAIQAAGGLSHLFNCSREELQWARKRFIADYLLVHETAQAQHLLGDGEAKRIISRLKEGADRKQLDSVSTEVGR